MGYDPLSNRGQQITIKGKDYPNNCYLNLFYIEGESDDLT